VSVRKYLTFDDFFYQQRKSLLAHAYVLTGNSDDAQDLVQEVFLRVWKQWEKVSQMDSPAAWSRTVLNNLAIGRWRRAKVEKRQSWRSQIGETAESGVSDVSDECQAPDAAATGLARELRRLPQKERTALLLYHVVGLRVSEVASEMSAPEGTVRSWLTRGRQSLAKSLQVSTEDDGQSSREGTRS
jgi:RNA polymerase sigma-70 factor, ECF subfamily